MKIITNLPRGVCRPAKNVAEGLRVGRKLSIALKNTWNGIGLAAPQIGLNIRVCVFYGGGKKGGVLNVLINPSIIEWSKDRVPFTEGCLSYPGQQFNTFRHLWVKVMADNLGQPMEVGLICPGGSLLESVVVQHEVSHLFGLVPTDFSSILYPTPDQWENWGYSLVQA